MRYLCLLYGDENRWEKVSKAEMDALYEEYVAFTEDIKRSGHHLAGDPLYPTRAAATVRVRNGRVSATDGPFAETKEQLGGYYAIEAKDLNEAIQIASRIPAARTGGVEVRPIWEMGERLTEETFTAYRGHA
jgi:hypothetical protein